MKKLKSISSPTKTLMLAVILLFGFTAVRAQTVGENYSSLVILKVKGLTTEVYNKITAGINKEPSITFEYSCLESNVVVIKCKHTFAQKADVQYFINNKLKQWVDGKTIEFIYLDVVAGGASKC